MEQQQLEKRVKQIFEDQGFEVGQHGNQLTASKDGVEKHIQVFSSDSYSPEEAEGRVEAGTLVFVDEGLKELSGELRNEVSVIREERGETDYDLPSYEIIGEIAVINELSGPEKNEVVEGILEHHPHVKTILLKEEPLSGEFRVGGYEKLYGEETETVHKEFGCRYRVDLTKAYFSERLATERKRVVDQIEDGERILVIGGGVGPYPILAAKNANPEKVVAVEKNPDAFKYLEQNIELNNVENIVEAVEGDARDVVPDLGKFDRVIIAIPEFADEFLELAFEHLEEGGIIHYYRFLEDENWDELIEEIDETREEYEILDKVVCGQRGPSVDRVCVDIRKK